jgi:asparagine synthetase B (glutamine-hydrolysing)
MYNVDSLSSYLIFRYLVTPEMEWRKNLKPKFPVEGGKKLIPVKTSNEIFETLQKIVKPSAESTLFLSGGIDSAILASFFPKRSKVYSIKFDAPNAIDETIMAKVYAEFLDLDLEIMTVTWEDYRKLLHELMAYKKSPLHPVEIALYKTAQKAKADGFNEIYVGNGADSTFGGLNKLLSTNWKLRDFIDRYTFLKPEQVLNEFVNLDFIYERYHINNVFNTQLFLKEIHGLGIIQSFNSSIEAAGCRTKAPYEDLVLEGALDLERIRNGDTKYLLRKVFEDIFRNIDTPAKIAFARPMDSWLADWKGPKRNEFKQNIDINNFCGEEKWLLYCLEKFLNQFDEK